MTYKNIVKNISKRLNNRFPQIVSMPEKIDVSVKKDIIAVLENSINAIKNADIVALRDESDHIVHGSAIYQHQESIQTAIVIYALSKILERGKTIDARILSAMKKAIEFMRVDNYRGFNTEIKNMLDMISTVDNQLSRYMQHIITEAQIKKGSKVYEHGISLGKTAEMFGISQWELMKYIGKTRMSEYSAETIPIERRLQFARGLFK